MSLHRQMTARFGPDAPTIAESDTPPTIELMLGHRSCRDFTDQPVDNDRMVLLLAAALSSPSKSDLQQVSVVWLSDPHLRRRVVELSPDNAWALDAPEVVVFCADGRRIRRAAERLGRPFPNNHLDQFMNAVVDCGIALGTAVQAAAALGLGCCPISELRDQADVLTGLLRLPSFVVPVAGFAVGWPADTGRAVTPRFPFDVRVMRNAYSDQPFDDAFDSYEWARDRLEQRPETEQRDTARFGVKRPYGWAEDRTRQYSEPRRPDWGAHVRAQGFGLD